MELLSTSGRAATLWMLAAFVAAFAVTRIVTHLIRAGRGPFRDNVQGGVHVHHLVYGIFAMMIAGVAEFSFRPGAPWYHVFAALFGAGAALTLDEYALWLYLGDVYWATEGRKSVDVVVYAAGFGALLLVASNPFADDQPGTGRGTFAATVAVNLAFALVCAYKGKAYTAVCGVLVPLIALVGTLRLAKPDSPWARRFYRPDGRKARRAQRRADKRSSGRLARWRDAVAGSEASDT
ncbi:hypothetical protein [Catenulispora subtropica]|uniref:Integral membrane protein n=1 Tax=Catenulispora subtropica TaxID=450798 RepID=A0ABP5CSJ2_9ACTN